MPRNLHCRSYPAPRLVLLMGLPGAGKSTLARALGQRSGDVVLDRDRLRARLFRGLPVTDAQKRAANAAVWRRAAALLRERRGVIVDGMTFARMADRRQAHRVAHRARAQCLEIYLDCPESLARQRVQRGASHPATDRRPELVTHVAARFEPVGACALRLDARRPAGALLRAALSWLAGAPRPARGPAPAPRMARRSASVRGAAT